MTIGEYILFGIIIILIFLPPKWDPAIRLKEWTLRNRDKRK